MMESVICVTKKQESLITPARPTPNHDLYLTELDFLARVYESTIHIYKADINTIYPAKLLKDALPKVLVHYYPLAGRFKEVSHNEGTLVLNCNGEGVVFAEAKANCTLENVSFLSEEPYNNPPEKSSLFVQFDRSLSIENKPFLSIQVTVFRCGGYTLGIRWSHMVLDGEGFSQFMRAFAEVTKHGESAFSVLPHPVWQRERLSPRQSPQFSANQHEERIALDPFLERLRSREQMVFSTFKCSRHFIDRLKESVVKESDGHRSYCSRFEGLSALIWKTYAEIKGSVMGLRFPVNARGGLRGMISQEGYYGNCIVGATLAEEDLTDKNAPKVLQMWEIVRKIRQAKGRVNSEEYVRSEIDYLSTVGNRRKQLRAEHLISDTVSFFDWSKFEWIPDFGIGKGISLAVPLHNFAFPCAIFLPNGMDETHLTVLVGLPEESTTSFRARFLHLLNLRC